MDLPTEIFGKVEHIGIAVEDLDAADQIYAQMLGVSRYKVEEVPGEGVRTAFYRVGETKIELLEPMHEESPVAKFIRKRGPGVHHIAFDVADIYKAMDRLREAGFILTRNDPVAGADQKLVCFVHPKSTGGTLIELCQDITE
jgi:methylmalonyl-CoA/ethylmalonyl-CoA epimerase